MTGYSGWIAWLGAITTPAPFSLRAKREQDDSGSPSPLVGEGFRVRGMTNHVILLLYR